MSDLRAARVLGLFAKQPRTGHVKTRLAAATSPEWAASVAEAFLEDLLDRLAVVEAERVLVFDPGEAESHFASLVQGRFHITPQRSGDLGGRLSSFVSGQFAAGKKQVVILGTDSPTAPVAFIEEAFRLLEQADVVLGPAMDGGYYLMGCARWLPSLFEGITWSSSRVLVETVARITQERLALLPPWYDVDTLDDWHLLRGHLAAMRRAGLDPGVPRTEQLALQASLGGTP